MSFTARQNHSQGALKCPPTSSETNIVPTVDYGVGVTEGRLKRALRALGQKHPQIYRHGRDLAYLAWAFRQGVWRALFRRSADQAFSPSQSVLEWSVPFNDCSTPAELLAYFRAHGIEASEGRHTIYLPPQDRLAALLPNVTTFYPSTAGFKILKDFRAPSDVQYLTGQSYSTLRAKLMGRPYEQAVVANYMYRRGIGPRIWDVCSWTSGQTSYTVFVLDHVAGRQITATECVQFLEEVEHLSRTSLLRILVPSWRQTKDFLPPNCNNNLIYSEPLGRPLYVDFQNFSLGDGLWTKTVARESAGTFHFGNGRIHRGERYLYQSVPGVHSGKRDTGSRWRVISAMTAQAGLRFDGRLVLDIGCNSGIMLCLALKHGAKWALGWDRPEIIDCATELLLSMGLTRFCLMGGTLHPQYPLLYDIPSTLRGHALTESLVFYLSVRQHVGMIQDLLDMPWRAFVYEGHQDESTAEAREVVRPLISSRVQCVASTYQCDGDSRKRPLLMLIRSDAR